MSEYDLEKFEDSFRVKIYLIRGYQVMLDRDLAELYGVKPFRLREQVKRNQKLSRCPKINLKREGLNLYNLR
jgi:hypothetical protein